MTGFGKAHCELKNKNITIEIRTLNGKQLDINCKLPLIFKEKESIIRNTIANELLRGKIEFTLSYELTHLENNAIINETVVKDYYRQLSNIADDLKIKPSEQLLQVIFRMPDVLKPEKDGVSDEEWKKISAAINEAINQCIAFRDQEGEYIKHDANKRVSLISSWIEEINPFESDRIERVKKRINGNLANFFEIENIDKNRFEQELIYYLERIDITEEKVRLKNHCSYFLETSEENGPIGKKLAFIIQEMGREINTIGSKANDENIQKLVVKMKDELEKIKEQMMNVL